MRRRVVITGMGVVTPLGHSVGDTFAALLAGKSGIDRITHFDARTFPTTFAAEVKGFDLAKFLPATAGRYSDSGLNTRFALAAAKQALDDSGLLAAGLDPTRVGVYMGTGEGSEDFPAVIAGSAAGADATGAKVDHGKFAATVVPMLHSRREAELEMNTTAAHVAAEFDLAGPNFICLTACAASAQAVGEAAEMIRYGDADAFVAGGSHSMIHPFGVTGFNLLTALSTRNDSPETASRPFDATRDGFVLGEGGGVVILEEYEHAKRRGAPIYAELTGYGTTGDAHAMTDPHPQGRGAIRSMTDALKDAGLNPADLGYINAHGTSTPANDETETLALKGALGAAAYTVPVSSTKSMLGHLIAAGGVVELIIAIQAMRRAVLPPTMNLHTPDPACDLDYVPNAAREKSGVRHVASNSFGFGGQNITLIASRI
ncbi:MAG: beta-ketoacyl-[acyl-carrier-protein] synthase family protein [Fimbriiglobus sp.]|jgi:3-oxoacyl-[acyl-carrier-protein] synthase II|nr:beta-ketoacyl-[acyl-carrier-protein] synthase family protein [Fimbriiglobus sp.]